MASLYAEIGAKTDGFERGAGKVKGELKSIAPALENVTRGVTGFISANAGLISVLVAVGAGLKNAMDETMKYAESVKTLAQIGNTSAEEASRFIQVLDDYKISAEDATAATRALTNNGMAPSIDTLAKLSDEYLKITDAQERNEFVIKNLGRGGLQWVQVLKQGSAAIKEQSKAVSDGLILTDEAIQKTEEYRLALDDWNDAILEAKVSIGSQLLPELTKLLEHNKLHTRALEIMEEKGLSTYHAMSQVGYAAAYKPAAGELEAANAAKILGQANDDLTQSSMETASGIGYLGDALAEEAKQAAEAISERNQEMMSFIMNYADSQEDYVKEHAAAVEAVAEAQRNLNEAIQEEGAGSEAADEATEALQGTRNELQQLEAEWHEKTQRMIYDMVLTKLSVDGLTTAEFNAAQQLGVTMGIFTQAEADKAIAMMQTADALVAQIQQQEALTTAIWGSVEAQQALNDVGGLSGGSSPDERDASTRDAGGMGIAGTPYLIGSGAQPEIFIPSTDGNFIPNADKKMGSNKNVNIVINNPKGQTSEQSMSKAARRLSYLGVLA